jgi:hypothetical protein
VIRQLISIPGFNATLRIPARELISVKTIYSSAGGGIAQTGASVLGSDGLLDIPLRIPSFKEFFAVSVEVKS